MFWITNNAFSLAYTGWLQFTPTRAILGLGPLPTSASLSEFTPNAAAGGYPLELSGAAKPQGIIAGAWARAKAQADEVTGASKQAAAAAAAPGALSVGRAQALAADTLAQLAGGMADRGQLSDAVGMQSRAVAMREQAMQPPSGEGGGDGAAGASAAADEELQRGLLHALWTLAELQDKAGMPSEAKSSMDKWQAAGGDAAVAEERQQRISAEAREDAV